MSSLEPASSPTAQDHGLGLLIRRVADGDQEALGQFYDATSAFVHGHHLGPGDCLLLVLATRGAIAPEVGP